MRETKKAGSSSERAFRVSQVSPLWGSSLLAEERQTWQTAEADRFALDRRDWHAWAAARRVIPLHFEHWAHFTQGRASLQETFARAGLSDRLRLPEPGEWIAV